MATNWVLSRRKYDLHRRRRMRSSTSSSTESNAGDATSAQKAQMTQIAINSVTVLAPARWARRIALHCANAGIPALLLDLSADVAKQGLEKARKLKPDPQFTPDAYKLVTTGGFDTHLDLIAKSDWIMEAVVERSTVKQQLLAAVDEKRRPGSIVSSNTSGIPIAAIAEGRSEDFRKHWLGTHFSSIRPRYLRLLEIIPTADTDPAVWQAMVAFGDHVLGKGVVLAKDTPNFIANHVGLYGIGATLDVLRRRASTRSRRSMRSPAGPRPSGSATFRTIGHRRHRRAWRTCCATFMSARDRGGSKALSPCPALVEQLIAQRRARRKDRQGLLRSGARAPAAKAKSGRSIPHARIPAEAIGAHRLHRGRQVDRRGRRARAHAVQQQGQGRRVPARHARADAGLLRRGITT
jgi:3-hydroxyacyl-CoA dehydrogenase